MRPTAPTSESAAAPPHPHPHPHPKSELQRAELKALKRKHKLKKIAKRIQKNKKLLKKTTFDWGPLIDDANIEDPGVHPDSVRPPGVNLRWQSWYKVRPVEIGSRLTLNNSLVTQTIEVMNRTEMVQGLIDTFATDNVYNSYLSVMPDIDLPVDTTANLVTDGKFQKPIWFIPPIHTEFTLGVPVRYPKLSKQIVREALRKSIAGLLRLKSFSECTESALVTMVDAVEEFIKSLLDSVNISMTCQHKDKNKHLNVMALEKGYYSLTNSSLTSFHNYYKNEIIQPNKTEIKEFKDMFQKYDDLKQKSQNIQKFKIDDNGYMGTSSAIYGDGTGINIISDPLLDSSQIFETKQEPNGENQ